MATSAVSIVAATGANIAPNGIRVGSVPVSTTGSVTARIVAAVQSTNVTADSPIQMGREMAFLRSRTIAHRRIKLAIPPQNQAVKAAIGRCCCSEPDTNRERED